MPRSSASRRNCGIRRGSRRGETDTAEKIVKRVEYDLYDIEQWSLFLDLLAIYKTLRMLLVKDENAY